MRLLPLLLLACLWLTATACDSRGPLPANVAAPLKTPDGSEVNIVCPPSLTDADPTKLATAMAQFNIHTPSSADSLATIRPPEAANSLSTLIPRESPAGPVNCCDTETNKDFGAPFGGGFASEEQLIQMGRLCGVRARGGMSMRVDLYAATAGATEAYKREADTMRPRDVREDVEPEDQQLLASVGDERKLTRFVWIVNGQKLDVDDYELLFRRRNVVARLRLTYGSFYAPGKGPPEPLLEYAAQLDRNIEAVAQ
jgi:hypothetical protein